MKIMASSPIISWQIDGEWVETVTDFNLRGSRITVDGDYSHEMKKCLGFPGGSDSISSACYTGDSGLIPGEGNGNPLQYPCLEKSNGHKSLVGCSPWGHRVGHDWATNTRHTFVLCFSFISHAYLWKSWLTVAQTEWILLYSPYVELPAHFPRPHFPN